VTRIPTGDGAAGGEEEDVTHGVLLTKNYYQ
jgi:hypothetical protein